MRNLVLLILMACVVVALSLAAQVNPGQVAVFFSPYRIDLSLNFAIFLVLAGFLLFYGLIRAVYGAIGLPERVRNFKLSRRREGAHNALRASVLALTEGRYSRVEHLALEAQVHDPDAVPTALLAAVAAHRLKQFDRRDRWLSGLRESPGETGLAARLLEAECLLEQGRHEDALATIEPVLQTNRRNLRAQQVAYRIFKVCGRWDELLRTARLLVNRNMVEDSDFEATIAEAYRVLISRRAQAVQQIWQLWRNATPRELSQLEVLKAFAQGFSRAGAPTHARSLLESALENGYRGEIVQLYAELFYSQPLSAIKALEPWLQAQPDSPELHAALGLLNAALENWQSASVHYERLFAIQPSAQTAAQLARVYHRMGNEERESHYRTTCVSLLLNV